MAQRQTSLWPSEKQDDALAAQHLDNTLNCFGSSVNLASSTLKETAKVAAVAEEDDPFERPPDANNPLDFPPEGEEASRVLIYSHSLPPWVDGVSTRFTAHLKLMRMARHRVHVLTIEEDLATDVRNSVSSFDSLTSNCFFWYPAKRFPNVTFANFAKIWKACRTTRPEVIHVTLCPSLPMFFVCACLLNIPIIMSIHTDSITLLSKCKQPWWIMQLCKLLEPLASYMVDATYTVSKSYGTILRQRGLNCIDLYWGGTINRKVFNPSRAYEGGNWREKLTFGHPDDFIMAFAGRISPEKDIDFLVELHKRFRDRNVWLVLVGDGPAAPPLAKLHGEKNKVYFVPGFMGHSDLAQVYASIDLSVSASTFETFGFTALESMACGTPFLGPRAQGYRDVVTHNKGGYLFDAKDINSASHYLELLIEEKAELFPPEQVLSATQDFTAEACLRRTLTAYDMAKRIRHTDSPLKARLKAALLFIPRLIMVILTIPVILFLGGLMAVPDPEKFKAFERIRQVFTGKPQTGKPGDNKQS